MPRNSSTDSSKERSRPSTNSSTRGLVGSILSRRDEPPRSQDSQSWPPQTPRSPERRRLTGGYPANTFSPSTAGSAPAGSPKRDDHYRKELNEKGIPRASKYNQGHEDYKGSETWGESAGKQYSEHLRSSSAPRRADRSGAPPGAYVGQPLGTPSYHGQAASYASNAESAYGTAAVGRSNWNQDNIGYSTKTSYAGHEEAAVSNRRSEADYGARTTRHRESSRPHSPEPRESRRRRAGSGDRGRRRETSEDPHSRSRSRPPAERKRLP